MLIFRHLSRILTIVALLLLAATGSRAQSITVLSPNGGEKYEFAEPVTVTWTAQGVSTLRLDYSSDNGNNWSTVAPSLPAASGSYTFVPTALPTKTAFVRLVDPAHQEINDRSDSYFEIMAPKSIIVFSPGGGERVPRGSKIVVSWDALRITAVDLYYSIDGGANWTLLASNIQAYNWSYEWTVPNRVLANVKVRVQEHGGSVYGESGAFEIVDPEIPTLAVEYPNGGEKFTVGDSITIRWASRGLAGPATVSYSTDGGNTWNVISATVPVGSNALGWRITSPPGTKYLVKVQPVTGPADQSDATFEVTRRLEPKIRVVSPNGGEKLIVGQAGEIVWTMTDLTKDVTVEYSVDSGKTWKPITSAQPRNGPVILVWPVPDDTTSHALIRVYNAEAGDTSDAVFAIIRQTLPPITVLVPNGGEVWKTGERRRITWSAIPSITAVDLYLSTDGGGHWEQIGANIATAGSGGYDWVVPSVGERGVGSSSARIRAQSHVTALENDLSDMTFTINPERLALGVDERGGGAGGFHLLGVFPNPSPGRAELRWLQGRASAVELRLYDAGGSLAASYDLGRRDAGENSYHLDASSLPGGAYLYELRSEGMRGAGVMVVDRR
jgi:hypothetical protein